MLFFWSVSRDSGLPKIMTSHWVAWLGLGGSSIDFEKYFSRAKIWERNGAEIVLILEQFWIWVRVSVDSST